MKTLVKLSCGKHYGEGPHCAKCGPGIVQRDIANQRNRALAAAMEPWPQSIQDRAIDNAKCGLRLN